MCLSAHFWKMVPLRSISISSASARSSNSVPVLISFAVMSLYTSVSSASGRSSPALMPRLLEMNCGRVIFFLICGVVRDLSQ